MTDIAEGVDVPRHRSPPFPFIGLRRALERAREFFERQRNYAAPTAVAVSLWGYAQQSSGGIQTIAALKHYGLLEDEGSGSDRKVKLTDLALRIIRDSRDPSPDRDALIKQAALTPKVFREIYDHFGPMLPAEGTVIYYLEQERGGFSEKSARSLIATYVDNINFARFSASDIFEDIGQQPQEPIIQPAGNAKPPLQNVTGVTVNAPGKVGLMENERVVFTEESAPQQYFKLIASGEPDEFLLEALEDYVNRQKRRLEMKAKKAEA